MHTVNTNHNPRIRPRLITSTSTSTSTDTSFSEYVLFPPNLPASTTTIQHPNPFCFQSGIPLRNLVLAQGQDQAPVQGQGQTPSSNFQFQFPLAPVQPQEQEQKTEEKQGIEEGEIVRRDTAFDVSILETEEQKKKKLQKKIVKTIEAFLQENEDDTYCLSHYTLFEIDGIQSDVYIGKEDDLYYYQFVAKNIEYIENESTDNNTDFLLIEKEDFNSISDVLEHIETVKNTYTFLDFYLLSPEKKETAKLHRSFLPLSQDKICSVCYEPTLEYTTCKHPICLKCREKCIVNDRKMCPVCRSSQLRFYPTELAKL